MVAVLEEMQFDLDGFVWGHGLPIFIDQKGFDPGDYSPVTQDGVNPITGARLFGRDIDSPSTWTWTCHVDRTNTEEALESAALMGSKWKSRKWKDTSAFAMLRYRLGGRTRVVFGRPRRFAFTPDNLIMAGYLPPIATFDLSDSSTYDELEEFTDTYLQPSTSGGFSTPFEAPLTVEVEEQTVVPGAVIVRGDVETAAVVDFFGPVTNPSAQIGDVIIGCLGTIPAGESVTIDARPWSQGFHRSPGAGSVGLSGETSLARAFLEPGAYQVLFRGTDATGTARCRVRWRNAHSTL